MDRRQRTITIRLRLATTIFTGTLYNTAMLGQFLAPLDVLSGGRLVEGLAALSG